MKPMRTVVIDRRIWLRGDPNSFLLRKGDKKRCCVGIYLRAVGVADDFLIGKGTASGVSCDLPVEAQWLLSPLLYGAVDSNAAATLYQDNDRHRASTTEEKREADIKEGFAQHGVKVVFRG